MIRDNIQLIYGIVLLISLNICMSILFFHCLKKQIFSSKQIFFRFVFVSLLVFGLTYIIFYVYNIVFTSFFGYISPHYSCIFPALYALFGTYFVLIFFELVKLADLVFVRIIHNSESAKQDKFNSNIVDACACPSDVLSQDKPVGEEPRPEDLIDAENAESKPYNGRY